MQFSCNGFICVKAVDMESLKKGLLKMKIQLTNETTHLNVLDGLKILEDET